MALLNETIDMLANANDEHLDVIWKKDENWEMQ